MDDSYRYLYNYVKAPWKLKEVHTTTVAYLYIGSKSLLKMKVIKKMRLHRIGSYACALS